MAGFRSSASPLFNVTPLGGATATLSWNLTGTPFIFNYLFVGTGPDGWKNMYQVSLDQQKVGEGVITINGLFDITQIGIYGFPSLRGVPDSGSAILMFGLSAGVLIALAARYRSRPFVAVSRRV